MTSWRDKLGTGPLPVLFLYFTLTGPLFGGVVWLITPDLSGWEAVASGVAFGLLFAGAMTVAVARVRRVEHVITGARRPADRLAMAGALRTGEPAADTSLDEPTLALIRRRTAGLQKEARALPILLAGVSLLILAQRANGGGMRGLAAMSLLGAALIMALVVNTRRRARLSRLEQEIHDRSH